MDLITSSLLIGGVWCVYTIGNKFCDACKDIYDGRYKWSEVRESLELLNYKVVKRLNTKYGFILTVQINSGGAASEIEKYKEQLGNIYKGKINIKDIPFTDLCEVEVINVEVKDLKYEYIELPPTQLLIGYDEKGIPIIADMKITPHILYTGLSNQGKSKCLQGGLKNLRGVDIQVLNGFNDDFPNSIIGNENILTYIKTIMDNLEYREKPLYIVFEELATVKDKEILKSVEELLCTARHYNIFICGVIQRATKESLKFKDLFNCVVSFRQKDDSNYRVALGESIDRELRQREFAFVSDNLYYGKTYLL